MLSQFRVYAPASLEEACEFLAESGPDAAVYAGGTELLLAMKEDLVAPDYLVDVKELGLGGVRVDDVTGELRLGATATHREIEAWSSSRPSWRALAELEHAVANVRVRNQGTIGGNLCFGEPHADPGTLLSAWDASVEIADASGRRRLPVEDFLLDEFVTALEDGEVVTAILVPAQPARSASSYLRFGFLERPSLGVAARIALEPDGETISEARVAVGAVGPHPERADAAERALLGVELMGSGWPTAVSAAASHAAEGCSVSGDAHGSESYKRHLVGVFVGRALEACRTRATAAARTEGAQS
jgi:carbon-monoxide dehydrogenase medium subunit